MMNLQQQLGWCGLVAILTGLGVGAAAAGTEAGKETFLAQKCNQCHSVSSAGIEATTKSEKMFGGDLTGVGERRMAEWIAKFVRREETIDGKQHKKEWKGTDVDLQQIVDWLATQKAPAS